jgi:hypothetical protein
MKDVCVVKLLAAAIRHRLDNFMLCGGLIMCWACPPANGGVDLVIKLWAQRSALGRVVKRQGRVVILAGTSGSL